LPVWQSRSEFLLDRSNRAGSPTVSSEPPETGGPHHEEPNRNHYRRPRRPLRPHVDGRSRAPRPTHFLHEKLRASRLRDPCPCWLRLLQTPGLSLCPAGEFLRLQLALQPLEAFHSQHLRLSQQLKLRPWRSQLGVQPRPLHPQLPPRADLRHSSSRLPQADLWNGQRSRVLGSVWALDCHLPSTLQSSGLSGGHFTCDPGTKTHPRCNGQNRFKGDRE